MNFTAAEELMATARSAVKGKPIANNTRLYYYEFRDCYSVRLHGYEILRIFPDRFEPSDAGWRTATTKARLNEHMPIGHIHQRDFTWYFTIGDTEYLWSDVHFVSTHTKHGDYPVMTTGDYRAWKEHMMEVEA